MKYGFFVVHVLALLLLIFKVPFTLFSNVVTATENQGITLNISSQTALEVPISVLFTSTQTLKKPARY